MLLVREVRGQCCGLARQAIDMCAREILFGEEKVNHHDLKATFVELTGGAAITLSDGVAAEKSRRYGQLNLPPIKNGVSPMIDLWT